MPSLSDADALQAALVALGGQGRPGAPPISDFDHGLAAFSYRLVGVAEGQAMRAHHALAADATAAGSVDAVEDEALIAETLGAAGCDSELDALSLLHWRSRCLSQAIAYIDIGGPHGAPDPVLQTIGATAAALTSMLHAARSLRDPDTGLGIVSAEAAEGWRAAIESLREVVGDEDRRSEPHAGHPHACDCR